MRTAKQLAWILMLVMWPVASAAQGPAPPPKEPAATKKPARCAPDDRDCVCRRRIRRPWARFAKRVKHVFYRCDNIVAWYPTISYRLDFGPTFGLRAFHKNLYGNGESVALTMRLGGRYIQSYRVDAGAPRLGHGRWYATASGAFNDLGNLLFRGVGNPPAMVDGSGLDPRAAAVETRFRKTATQLTVRGGRNVRRRRYRLQVGGVAALHNLRFGTLDADAPARSIEQVYDVDKLPGFTDGATVVELLGELAWDGRDRPMYLGQGFSLRLFAGGAPPLNKYRYTRHGGELSYSLRVGRQHMLSATIVHETVMGNQENIPFTTQPRLGGVNLLRGYAAGSLRDRLAAVAIARYEFPLLHRAFRGAVFADMGKVAPSYGALAGWRNLDDLWQRGGGVAVLIQPTTDIRVRLAMAYGDGFQIRFTSTLASFSHGQAYIP